MKVSLVVAVLNSPEIVRRQILHWRSMNLPDDFEVILVDDGSDPPLSGSLTMDIGKNLSIYETHDTRNWTQPAARNFGARLAKGDYLILTDIDHIIAEEVVLAAYNATTDIVRFKRQVAVLDENGVFTQDMKVMKEWGFRKNDVKIIPHSNSYIFRRELFLELGGVDERYVGTGKYPNREEVPLKRKVRVLEESGDITILQDRTKPTIYMFPNGHYCGHKDSNPFGFFHNTPRARHLGRISNKEKHANRRARKAQREKSEAA